MKLLYFGNERLDAQNLATAVRAIARNGTVSWTTSADRAAAWIADNKDVAALVVEGQVDAESWRSILACVRSLSPRPAVIVVTPEGAGEQPPADAPGADHYVERNSPQFRDLPMVVIRAVARARGAQEPHHQAPTATLPPPTSAAPETANPRLADLERKLTEATAALQQAERRHASAMADATNQLAERQLQYEAATAGTAARWEVVDEQLRAAAIEAESARHSYAAAAARIERLSQQEAELTSQLAAAVARTEELERRLADETAALERRLANETAALEGRLADETAVLKGRLADETAVLKGRLADETAALERRLADERAALEGRLADTTNALDAVTEQAAQDRLAAAGELAERQRELQTLVDAERSKRVALEAALAEAGRARDDAETQHAAAMVEVAAQLRDLDAALRRSRHDHESSAAEVTRLSARETELSEALEDVRTSHGNLERRLTATEAAFHDADERATRERLAATRKAATREAELESRIRQERESRVDVERALAAADVAREETQQRHEGALTAAAHELSEHQTRFDRDRTQLAGECDRLAAQVREVEGRLAQEQADLESRIRQERDSRVEVERALAAADVAREETQQRHEGALTAAAHQLSEHQTRFDRDRAQLSAERDRLAAQIREVEGRLAQEQADHRSTAGEVASLSQRRADLSSRVAAVEAELADTKAAREAVERRLVESVKAAASKEAEHDAQIQRERDANAGLERTIADLKRSAADEVSRLTQREADLSLELSGLNARLADSEAARHAIDSRLADTIATAAAAAADLEDQLDKERASRSDLERAFADSKAAWSQAQHEHEAALAAATDALAQDRDRFERERSQSADERDRLSLRLRDVEGSLTATERRLVETGRSLEEATRRADQDRTIAATREADLESRLTQEIGVREALEQTVTALRAAAVEAGRRFQMRQEQVQAELAQSTRRVDEARAEHQQAIDRLALEHEIVVSGHRHETQQLRDQLTATLRDLDSTRQRLNAVQAVADGLPTLQRTLDETRAENGRLFQQTTLAMFRCTRDGEVTQANRAAMTLVGRRTIAELRGAQFAAGVFEDPNGLSWLIERCVTSRTRESIETTWRRKDGGRLFVRLSAYAFAPDAVEIVAEDVTRVRVLQERLAQAHRLEAVGRLGSEVAVSCGNLLTDVHQQVQELLLAAATIPAVRQHGRQLLADVTRAAGLMRQLHAYGEEPVRAPMPADLSEVIHDLEPVLKRVAGDAVDVQLPGTSSRLNVDVGSERIERLLVNLASYGRARMPGGQLRIELGTTVVDRRFADKHPNVRLGPHALITVTKTKSARAAGELPRRDQPAGTSSSEASKPSIDFGTLHGLVGGCGGHLWMTLQPEGGLVAKIRLPLLAFPGETAPRTLVARGGRALTRLFQH